jgi:integrase/recombinase XerD
MAGSASFTPCLVAAVGEVPSLGDPLVDEYLRFTAARVRPNTLTAQTFDLKVFFTVVARPPQSVRVDDVLGFIEAQRAPRRGDNVVRLADGEAGLAASTIKRRLATVSSLFDYLLLRGLVDRNPVPRSMGARHRGHRGVPLVRAAKKLPRVLSAAEVVALAGALRTDRDRAMVALMVLGGLRRCEVLGLRFNDVQVGDRRVFVAEGKGGHQRLVPVAAPFFTALSDYLTAERPAQCTHDQVFVVLKGPNRGRPLTAAGVDQVLSGARGRAGLAHATCHELRHTCFTRLREAGMALEAIQAQAGHASIETTRIYLHLSNDWLAGEYQKAMAILDDLHTDGPARGAES